LIEFVDEKMRSGKTLEDDEHDVRIIDENERVKARNWWLKYDIFFRIVRVKRDDSMTTKDIKFLS